MTVKVRELSALLDLMPEGCLVLVWVLHYNVSLRSFTHCLASVCDKKIVITKVTCGKIQKFAIFFYNK